MAHAITFDTLAYSKKLKAAGVPQKQAEVQAEALAEFIEEGVATKKDLKDTEVALRRDIKVLESDLKREMKEMELRLTLRMGAIISASIAIVAALVKLL
jgi:hypothetical protein